jgi:carbon storage regulator
MLVLSRRQNEKVIIANNIHVTVLSINGQQVKLGFEAPKNIEIHREEIFKKIQQEKMQHNRSEEN